VYFVSIGTGRAANSWRKSNRGVGFLMAPRTPPSRISANRGAGLFGEPAPEAKLPAWRANVDGGSRGNPGPASYGVVIRDPRGEIVARLKKYIGRTTNNVAEYYGLIAALDYAQSNNIRALRIESDSELLVKQMRGQYKVKSVDLKPLYERAKKMSQAIPTFRIDHVYREQNREADLLANEAMDEVSGKPPAVENRDSKMESGNSKMENRNSVPTIKVRARFRSGILYPLEDVDLPDGAEVEILLRPTSKT
jgi:ribonuclease HI